MIHLKSVKKAFQVDHKVIPAIDIHEFKVNKGEQIVIYGPSGGGKTTLLNLIAGILSPDEGEIRIHGTAITRLSGAKRDVFRLKHIGYIFQTYNLISTLTAEENIQIALMFGGISNKKKQKKAAREMLEKVGLQDRALHKPYQLSCGEQQRIALARAFANDPFLILADEPTANLDPENTEKIVNYMKTLCRETGKTLLIATHDLDIVKGSRAIAMHEINHAEGPRE